MICRRLCWQKMCVCVCSLYTLYHTAHSSSKVRAHLQSGDIVLRLKLELGQVELLNLVWNCLCFSPRNGSDSRWRMDSVEIQCQKPIEFTADRRSRLVSTSRFTAEVCVSSLENNTRRTKLSPDINRLLKLFSKSDSFATYEFAPKIKYGHSHRSNHFL